MFKFIHLMKLYFKYILKFYRTKIFDIGEFMADLQKRVIKKGFAMSSITLHELI